MGTLLGIPVGHADSQPPRFDLGHVDLALQYVPNDPEPLRIVVTDSDLGVVHPATNAVLVAVEGARLELPADIPPLGQAGDPLWVLPQSQNPLILFVGLSAGGVPPGTFDGPLELRLVGCEGPGSFFLWQSEFGSLQFFMNTHDGVGPEDWFPELPGGHSHANWGFTTNGVYRLTLVASGRRLGESTNVQSAPTPVTFHVEPLPPTPSPFGLWQAEHWPGITDPSVIGPEADPDLDHRRNLEEYALGTHPGQADPPPYPNPTIEWASTPAQDSVRLRTYVREGLSDLVVGLWSAPELRDPWTPLPGAGEWSPPVDSPVGPIREGVWREAVEVAPGANRFYRVAYQLKDNP